MTEYKRFDENAWSSFGERLLKNKGSEKQVEFLRICRSGKSRFLDYIEECLPRRECIIAGEGIVVEHQFGEVEFCYPPENTQKIIWDVFEKIPHEMMSYCGFWGYIIIDMIKRNYIKPEYLASNLNGINETGIYMIDQALNINNEKTIDDVVRRILRSMCNSAPRGKRIVFNDFYLGKAYWRWHWAKKMSQHIGLNFEQILTILDETSYADFSAKMHSGKSYIGSINILGGLLLFLAQNSLKGKLVKVIDRISYLSAWKAIEAQSPELNKLEIQRVADSVL